MSALGAASSVFFLLPPFFFPSDDDDDMDATRLIRSTRAGFLRTANFTSSKLTMDLLACLQSINIDTKAKGKDTWQRRPGQRQVALVEPW